MHKFVVVLLLALLCAAAEARELRQTQTVQQALQAAQGTRVSTFLSALQAAGISLPNDARYTLFVPTNEAFTDDDVREATGLTAAQLLEPANRQALTQLLSYHVVPSAALRAAQLTDGQQLTTLLAGAAPLRVDKDDDGVEIEVPSSGREGGDDDDGDDNDDADDDDNDSADVIAADIVAGSSIVHVIDEVLIPASLRRTPAAVASGR